MEEKAVVTPWDVLGDVNYDRLIKEFGISKIDDKLLRRLKKHTGELHFMLRRSVFFAHRDLDFALNEYEKGKNLFLYTGCGPSGPIHLGHAMIWSFVKWLQDALDLELWFQFTDDEKFLFKDKSYEEIQKWMHENVLDVIALGFKPEKTHFLVNTKHANLIYPEAIKVAKKITFSMVKSSFGLNESSNVGEIFYTSMQAVPAFLPCVLKKKKMACLIPHAVDQDAHFRLTRDIIPRLGYYKPASIQCSFLPPLNGMSGKMSSTKEMAIFLSDSPEEVKKKINKYAFSGGQATIEEHRKLGGNPEIDVSFQYLKMFFEPYDEKLKEIEKNYRSGKLLTGELKAYLIEKISAFLREHQKKREKARKDVDNFFRV